MDYLAFGFSDGVGSRSSLSSLSLQNGDQPIERRTSRLWINKLTVGRWLPAYGEEAPL